MIDSFKWTPLLNHHRLSESYSNKPRHNKPEEDGGNHDKTIEVIQWDKRSNKDPINWSNKLRFCCCFITVSFCEFF